MRIVHINGVYQTASTGRLIGDLVEDGRARGHESLVLCSEGKDAPPTAIRYISDMQRNVHAVLSRVSGLQGYWSRAATRELLRRIEAFGPDVVHLHVLHGNCVHLPMLFAYLRVSRTPVVITLHDCWWFTGRCAHPTQYDCAGFTRDCAHCPAKRDVCPSWFFDRAKKMLRDKARFLGALDSLSIVAISNWSAAQAERSFLRDRHIDRIGNWVDTAVFRPVFRADLRRALGLANERVVLGVAANWEPRKGLDDFLWLSAHLPPGFRVVLVGNLPPLPEGTNIVCVPATNERETLAALYSMADVYVNASKMETFGLTTVEAMACGTPAVVYDVTACGELVSPKSGRVVAPDAGAAGLMEAVLTLSEAMPDPAACRAWAQTQFGRAQGIAAYDALYESLLSANKGRLDACPAREARAT